MPTPLDILLDPLTLAAVGLYFTLLLLETLAPARALPTVRGWRWKGIVAFLAYLFVATYLPLLWSEAIAPLQVVDLSRLHVVPATVVGLLVYEFGVWAWHRTMHRYDVLWRSFHQMHHSAERIDVSGAFWFSPLDMVGWTALFSLCLTIVGLPVTAIVATNLIATLLTVFQHANLRTPTWLGYLVQRPESHSRHHERGVHAGNYSDLPLFDLLFGTFVNPREFVAQNGFYDGASRRLGDMLLARDVSVPKEDQRAPTYSLTRSKT